MKKVVIDGRMVTPIPHGFARYVARLAEGLRQVLASQRAVVAPLYEPIFLVNHQTAPGAFGDFKTVTIKSEFLNPKELFEIPKYLYALGADLYHSPTFSSLLFSPCPWLLTIHDLNHLQFGDVQERLYYRWILKRFAKKAKGLLTVSRFSQHEIANWTRLPRRNIEIVPNALDPNLYRKPDPVLTRQVLDRFGLEAGKFFFCLSNNKPHKNVALLVSAYAALGPTPRTLGKHWPLVLTMKGMCSTPINGVMELGSTTDAETHILMHAAGAIVFPSLYEGFGLPPVEAASIGVPLILSDIAPHQEALTDLASHEAVWVGAQDTDGWTHALSQAEQGHLPRPALETQERVRNHYSVWSLGQTMDRIYRSLLT